MASVYNQVPSTPRQAARRKARLDQVLRPDLLKALAEPTRARLLSCLLKCGRPCSVTEVAECCSIDFSVVARHLSTMARAGLLNFEKRSRVAWYTARREELAAHFRALADAIDELDPAGFCCPIAGCECSPSAGSST